MASVRGASGHDPRDHRFSFVSTLYLTPSFGPIAFVSLPEAVADAIEALPALPRRGFGSLRVEVTAPRSDGSPISWATSIFPGAETYVLPIKRQVRTACGVDVGDELALQIAMLDWS